MRCSRREACGLIVVTGARLLAGCGGGSKSDSGPTRFPPTDNGTLRLAFVDYPALLETAGWVRGIPPDRTTAIIVVHVGSGSDPADYAALEAACTHFGCGVGYDGGRLECPCHGSLFALDGAVLRGPATVPLLALAVATTADGVEIAVG